MGDDITKRIARFIEPFRVTPAPVGAAPDPFEAAAGVAAHAGA
jgi:hypothetical protein